MEIIKLPLDELHPDPSNAKDHPEWQIEQIKASIETFGNLDPIGIWGKDNLIVEGHGRYEALKQLGYNEAECIRLDWLTDEERRAYALAHNKLTMNSGFIPDVLDLNLDAIGGIDMSLFGFDVNQEEEQINVVEDEPPEEVETRCKLGDIWRLGQHRLMCGDSTDSENVSRLMEGETARLLLTDPPYNVNVGACERPHSSNNNVFIMNDSMNEEDFIGFLTKALKNADHHMSQGAAFYIWYAGLHHIEFERAVRNIEEFKLHEQLVWVKSHFVLGRNSDYQWMHEPCLYGWKRGEHYFTDSRAEGTVIEDKNIKLSTLKKGELIALCERWMGMNISTTILRADKPLSADMHPTVKPQELLCTLLKNSSQQGWNVLDLFGGSGSTLIACEQLKRKCFTMELDPHYCDVIIQRWENFTGQKAVKLNA